MISQVDEALREIVKQNALRESDVEVVFDAPTKDWAARRNAPTVNLYLYDIREDLRRRHSGFLEQRDEETGHVTLRRPAPRLFKLSYLVTAWTQRPEDEHRLLDSLLRAFLLYDALPPALVTGPLADPKVAVKVTVGLPPPEDRAFADVWTALGGELKPSLDLVVTAPIWTGREFPAGPPVEDGVYVDMADMVDGGTDSGAHRHKPPPPSAAAVERANGKPLAAVGEPRARGTKQAKKPRPADGDGD